METPTTEQLLLRAAPAGDLETVRRLASQHPDLLITDNLSYMLRRAADENHIDMMRLLVELGADIHARNPRGSEDPEGVIDSAAGFGAIDAVRWLLDHGAKINFEVDGVRRCFPLSSAVLSGNLDLVKLLVERGAEINATWAAKNATSIAAMYGKKEIEAYLRSQGGLTPSEIRGEPLPRRESRGGDSVLDHVREHLGEPDPLSLHEIVPGEPSITIHLVRMDGGQALVTDGMSSRPMTVPAGAEAYRFAELVMYLPENWPLDIDSLGDPRNMWPIEWLRRVANYPHENRTWLRGKAVVFANGKPPRALAPNTKLTCLLAVTEESDFGCLARADGSQVLFYTLYPLYTEERDLEKREGTVRLIELFQEREISPVVDIHRENVAG